MKSRRSPARVSSRSIFGPSATIDDGQIEKAVTVQIRAKTAVGASGNLGRRAGRQAVDLGEVETCAANGVTDIIEVRFGYDGIVFASQIEGPRPGSP